jgi:hypothetical protein
MPIILKIYGFRFFFYSKEESRAHIHVSYQGLEAKVWLDNFEVAENKGFKKHDLVKVVKLVRIYEENFKAAWEEHFEENDK